MPSEQNEKAAAKAPAKARKRGGRPPEKNVGVLWARCPECHMPVKDAELFKHLLNCPGVEARQAEWAAEQAAAAAKAQADAQAAAAQAKVAEPDVQVSEPDAQAAEPELQRDEKPDGPS